MSLRQWKSVPPRVILSSVLVSFPACSLLIANEDLVGPAEDTGTGAGTGVAGQSFGGEGGEGPTPATGGQGGAPGAGGAAGGAGATGGRTNSTGTIQVILVKDSLPLKEGNVAVLDSNFDVLEQLPVTEESGVVVELTDEVAAIAGVHESETNSAVLVADLPDVEKLYLPLEEVDNWIGPMASMQVSLTVPDTEELYWIVLWDCGQGEQGAFFDGTTFDVPVTCPDGTTDYDLVVQAFQSDDISEWMTGFAVFPSEAFEQSSSTSVTVTHLQTDFTEFEFGVSEVDPNTSYFTVLISGGAGDLVASASFAYANTVTQPLVAQFYPDTFEWWRAKLVQHVSAQGSRTFMRRSTTLEEINGLAFETHTLKDFSAAAPISIESDRPTFHWILTDEGTDGHLVHAKIQWEANRLDVYARASSSRGISLPDPASLSTSPFVWVPSDSNTVGITYTHRKYVTLDYDAALAGATDESLQNFDEVTLGPM